MPMPSSRSFLWPVAVAVLAAGAGVTIYRLRSPDDARPPSTPGLLLPAPDAHFQERATEAGITWRMNFLPSEQGEKFKINLYDHGCGVAVADFDGDGMDDIYFCNQLGTNALYRNLGGGRFEDVTAKAGVGLGDRVCVGAAWGDYDNDGRPDLFVTSTRGGNALFHNEGNGRFREVTKEAGVAYAGHSQTAVFFDYDGDGFLDLLVTNTARWTLQGRAPADPHFPGLRSLEDMAKAEKETNILYHNVPDGKGGRRFMDVTARAGLAGRGWGGDVAVFDFDGDGKPDVLITNMFGQSQLYRNRGDGTFQDVTRQTLKVTSWGAIGAKAFDYDNDGRLDLLIADMHSDMWVPQGDSEMLLNRMRQNAHRKHPTVTGPSLDPNAQEAEEHFRDMFNIKYDQVIFGNTLFHSLGQGKFEEVSDKAGVETFWPWGIATGDFDNDGHEDVFLPAGMGFPWGYWPNSLMMNNGNGTFADRAREEGIEPPARGEYLPEKIGGRRAPRSSRCAAVADFEGDGRLWIVTNNFNDQPYLFANRFPPRNWVEFRLRGTRSNRDAIGALVKLYAGNEVMLRQVHPAGGYLSQSSLVVHFGLGDRQVVDRVEITWPSGARQTIERPPLNRRHAVTEPEGSKP